MVHGQGPSTRAARAMPARREESMIIQSIPDGRPIAARKPLLSAPLFPGARGDRAGRDDRPFLAVRRQIVQTARRGLHQAGEDDDRTGDLPHRGERDRRHARAGLASAASPPRHSAISCSSPRSR